MKRVQFIAKGEAWSQRALQTAQIPAWDMLRLEDTAMSLSHVYKFLAAADPFVIFRANFRLWTGKLGASGANQYRLRGRHLTEKQREDISSELQKSETLNGPVLMEALASDREAVGYEGEIANVLEETGFKVEIDNPSKRPSEKTATGVEIEVKDKTVRPAHASGVVSAFRRAGVALATRINRKRQKNDTLYITVGPNGPPAASATISDTEAELE